MSKVQFIYFSDEWNQPDREKGKSAGDSGTRSSSNDTEESRGQE